MPTIAVTGHLCVDLTPQGLTTTTLRPGELVESGELTISLGGSVANTSKVLTALGVPVRICAKVGDDELGGFATEALAADPLVSGMPSRLSGVGTSYSIVLTAAGVDRAFWHHVGANAFFEPQDVALDGIDLLHLGYPSLLPTLLVDDAAPLVDLFERAHRSGITTSLDLAVVDPGSPAAELDWRRLFELVLPHVDVLSPSLDDLLSVLGRDRAELGEVHGSDGSLDLVARRERVEQLGAELIAAGAAVVAISDGADGLYLRTATAARLRTAGRALAPLSSSWADVVIRVPAPAVASAGTNGAGDAATAGLLTGIHRGLSAVESAHLAVAAAAAVISAVPSIAEAVAARTGSRGADPVAAARSTASRPLLLQANQPPKRFYAGGSGIARFRGMGSAAPNTPEDWVASTVGVRGHGDVGLTRLPDGSLLRDAVAADPAGWLGREHAERWGADPMMLVKLLDAGQRLPVHAHPDAAFARRTVGAVHGKAEAWHILEPGAVHLALRRDVPRAELLKLVERQDTTALLDCLHEIEVQRGDTVFVPPGVLHAIGQGVLLVEVQEPEDLSILLEWRDFALDGARDGHLGLGFELALTAVEVTGRPSSDVEALLRRADDPGGGTLPAAAERYFRLESVQVEGRAQLDPGFAVLVGVAGDLHVIGSDGHRTNAAAGRTVLLPAAASPLSLHGTGSAVIVRPPDPGTAASALDERADERVDERVDDGQALPPRSTQAVDATIARNSHADNRLVTRPR